MNEIVSNDIADSNLYWDKEEVLLMHRCELNHLSSSKNLQEEKKSPWSPLNVKFSKFL